MNKQYINTLLEDIDKVLSRPLATPYEKATIPSLMVKFKRYLTGEIRNIRKWEIWNALSEIASLYGMSTVFNRNTRLAYFHVKNAPSCYSGKHPCVLTYYGTFPIRQAEQSIFDCINITKNIFVKKYKDNPVFKEVIDSINPVDK